jgi:methylglutaconyl-CoA hydratase
MKRMADYTARGEPRGCRRPGAHAATVIRCPKPTIAKVQGDVYAGGTGLVAACDIAVAWTRRTSA